MAIFDCRHYAAFLPKPLGNWQGVDVDALPPCHFIAGLMQLPMVTASEGYGEFVADFETQSSGLGKPQVMRIGPVLWHRRNNKWHNAPGLIGGDTRKRLHGAKIIAASIMAHRYSALLVWQRNEMK